MFGFLKQVFGTQQSRLVNKYQKIVYHVNEEEKKLTSLTDEQLKAKTQEFRQRISQGESVDQLLPEAYAVVKAACRRLCGTEVHVSGYDQKWDMVPYDVQILGAIALHYGSIAEMGTGEGKTLTASMPLYLNALTGKPVHLVTVNDYLAQRDCEWIGAIFRWLGLRVEPLTNQTSHFKRKDVYSADIVYGTSSEFGFDYLRDNSMAQNAQDQCQRGHYFAIIDEVDSILIDEARTPLIISGPASGSKQMYDALQEPVAHMVRFQRDLCNKLANEARKTLEILDRFVEGELKKLSKSEEAEEKEAYRKLWLVSKGMPNNKVLKRVKEDPNLRAQIDKWDVYFYGESNKEERAEALAQLYIIVDERASEYELTDKGIHLWSETGNSADDFTMFDLGFEYAKID
ncbi:MAG TPA: preprotein translocase subunit SecA, partial [Rhabdochlamydiaceae bacterium]|nr:preprotein translocase subunit SecA [Rhabdochlamydiaceae bacterium]